MYRLHILGSCFSQSIVKSQQSDKAYVEVTIHPSREVWGLVPKLQHASTEGHWMHHYSVTFQDGCICVSETVRVCLLYFFCVNRFKAHENQCVLQHRESSEWSSSHLKLSEEQIEEFVQADWVSCFKAPTLRNQVYFALTDLSEISCLSSQANMKKHVWLLTCSITKSLEDGRLVV